MEPDADSNDLFDDLLTLEDDYYKEGYRLGVADGSCAGRLEGRALGLEKGFEKYAAMGALHGRATVWAARLARADENNVAEARDSEAARRESIGEEPRAMNTLETTARTSEAEESANVYTISERSQSQGPPRGTQENERQVPKLPLLEPSLRLEKHIRTLQAWVQPSTMPVENSEEAVAEFDDRLKRAAAKVKVIEKILGETSGLDGQEEGSRESRTGILGQREKIESSIEDFVGRGAR